MKDPESVTLKHVKFHSDLPAHSDLTAISYFFSLDGKDRVISYSFEEANEDNTVKIDVRETPQDAPLVEVLAPLNLAAGDSVRASTREGEFVLKRGEGGLPAATDGLSVWLLAQNWVINSTTAPDRIWDIAVELVLAPEGAQILTTPFNVNINWDDFWDFFGNGSDCINPNQSTSCTETNAAGASITVPFSCDCGTPFCTNQRFSTDVPVLVTDASTGESHYESYTVYYTMCVCWCMELS